MVFYGPKPWYDYAVVVGSGSILTTWGSLSVPNVSTSSFSFSPFECGRRGRDSIPQPRDLQASTLGTKIPRCISRTYVRKQDIYGRVVSSKA